MTIISVSGLTLRFGTNTVFENVSFSLNENDNLGIVEHPPAITWHDDVHYMPFDGTVDWNAAAAKIRAAGYSGTLTLELTSKKKVPQNPDTRYERMSFEEFVRESYAAAERFAAMCDGGEV